MCLRAWDTEWYETYIPQKICNQTKMTLKPFEWHLEMEKTSANDCWDWIMRASGKTLQPARIQLSLTRSREQLDFCPRGRRQCFRTVSQQRQCQRSAIFMCFKCAGHREVCQPDLPKQAATRWFWPTLKNHNNNGSQRTLVQQGVSFPEHLWV